MNLEHFSNLESPVNVQADEPFELVIDKNPSYDFSRLPDLNIATCLAGALDEATYVRLLPLFQAISGYSAREIKEFAQLMTVILPASDNQIGTVNEDAVKILAGFPPEKIRAYADEKFGRADFHVGPQMLTEYLDANAQSRSINDLSVAYTVDNATATLKYDVSTHYWVPTLVLSENFADVIGRTHKVKLHYHPTLDTRVGAAIASCLNIGRAADSVVLTDRSVLDGCRSDIRATLHKLHDTIKAAIMKLSHHYTPYLSQAPAETIQIALNLHAPALVKQLETILKPDEAHIAASSKRTIFGDDMTALRSASIAVTTGSTATIVKWRDYNNARSKYKQSADRVGEVRIPHRTLGKAAEYALAAANGASKMELPAGIEISGVNTSLGNPYVETPLDRSALDIYTALNKLPGQQCVVKVYPWQNLMSAEYKTMLQPLADRCNRNDYGMVYSPDPYDPFIMFVFRSHLSAPPRVPVEPKHIMTHLVLMLIWGTAVMESAHQYYARGFRILPYLPPLKANGLTRLEYRVVLKKGVVGTATAAAREAEVEELVQTMQSLPLTPSTGTTPLKKRKREDEPKRLKTGTGMEFGMTPSTYRPVSPSYNPTENDEDEEKLQNKKNLFSFGQ